MGLFKMHGCYVTLLQKGLVHNQAPYRKFGNRRWLCIVLGHCMCMHRVSQNGINTLNMTVYWVNSLPIIPFLHRIFMVLANPVCMR